MAPALALAEKEQLSPAWLSWLQTLWFPVPWGILPVLKLTAFGWDRLQGPPVGQLLGPIPVPGGHGTAPAPKPCQGLLLSCVG